MKTTFVSSVIPSVLSCFLGIVLSTACSYDKQDDELSYNLDNIKVLAETYAADNLLKDRTNWIPGSLFPTKYGYEEVDYVVFSQKGVISLNPLFFRSDLVPEEYVSFTGLAPERSFELLIKMDPKKITRRGDGLTFNLKKVEAEVEFTSAYCCLGFSNTQTVLLTVSGSLTAQDTTDGIVHYVGNLTLLIELPGNQTLTLKYTELYYNQYLDLG